MDWLSFFLGIIATILTSVVLFFILPALEEPRRKFLKWLKHEPHVPEKLMTEIRILEMEILPSLRKINAIPSYPDELKAKDIRDILISISEKAGKLEYKDFADLRGRLIELSNHSTGFDVNTNPLTILKLLDREKVISLMNDIGETISDTKKGKTKKKKKA